MLDRELLSRFVESRSEDAFAQIVHRHMDAVYSSARRQVRDNQLAEDVTQAVFIVLARKAPKLLDRDSLAGWLMKTAHLASLDAIKSETRRRHHEQRAALLAPSGMEQNMTPSSDISAELDHALSRLKESDRSAVALRYLQGKSTVETAQSLGITEPAAAKRITRAIGRLRKMLLQRRAITPTVALAGVLEQLPRAGAPSALAASTITAATTGSASPVALSIAKGVMHMLTFHKVFAAVVTIIVLAGVGTGTVKLLADDQNPAPGSLPAPVAVEDTPRVYNGTLSNGVSIEVLGVCTNPSTNKQWWLPNGDLLATPPYAYMGARLQMGPGSGTIMREFAVTTSDTVSGSTNPATIIWGVQGSRGSSSSTVQSRDHKNITSIDGSVVAVPDNPAGATIRAQVAAGNWTTRVAGGGNGASSMSGPEGSFLFSNRFVVDGRTHIVVAFSGKVPEYNDVRLVAIDQNGKTFPCNQAGSANNQSGYVGEYSVKLPPNSIRDWELQTRPFDQWIEIRGISLHAGQKTDVTAVTSDDQPKK